MTLNKRPCVDHASFLRMKACFRGAAWALVSCPIVAFADWSNELDLEYRYFFSEPQFAEQERHAPSIAFTPQWNHTSDSGKHVYDFQAFARYDAADDERTHFDLNELSWTYASNNWEIKTGVSKIFWGVAETQHLVDIVNQTDAVDRLDGEIKLGQPMLSFSQFTNYGAFDLLVLPYFRERTFAGEQGRLRPSLVVDTDSPIYESSREQNHLDYALRWSHTFDAWDVGLSYFDGTGRDPVLRPNQQSTSLIPHYVQIEQFGIDVQATFDEWLLKLEGIKRSASLEFPEQEYNAVVAGIEYSFFDIAASGADVGLVVEYLYDSRGDEAVFDNYGVLALRLALNDEQSTDLLFGCGVDGRLCFIEGSRRINDVMSLSLRGNSFSNIDDDSQLASQRGDDFMQINLKYFF